jgi:hypothetical protein
MDLKADKPRATPVLANGTEPTSPHEGIAAPRSPISGELSPATSRELNPSSQVAAILKEHRELIRKLTQTVKESHTEEQDPSLKAIKAFDTLISESFRTAARGPEFLLPAIVSFLHVAERSRKLIRVECPTLKRALIDEELHSTRGEIISAPRLLNQRPRDIVSGSVNNSSELFLEAKKKGLNIIIEFGVPLIQVGDNLRLPGHTEPVENAILTSAFLTLLEECIHASQQQRRSRLYEMHKYSDNHGIKVEDIACSRLASQFFRETQVDLSPEEKKIQLHCSTLEIDAVARSVEMAREHNFPLQCLTPELRLYHQRVRSEFVDWLEKKGLIPPEDGTVDYAFKAPGLAEPVPSVRVSLTEDSKDLLEFLNETADGALRTARYRGLLPAIEKIVGDVAEFSLIAMRAARIEESLMKRVLTNLEAAQDADVIPRGWHEFASEEHHVHQSPIAALALQEYLSRIGFLKER